VERIQRNQSTTNKSFSANLQKKSQFEPRGFAKNSDDSETVDSEGKDFEVQTYKRPPFTLNALSRPGIQQEDKYLHKNNYTFYN
jgi:hypothetical protein